MRNLRLLILSLFTVSVLLSCRNEEKHYEDENLLSFADKKVEKYVPKDDNVTVKIPFGTISNASGNHEVEMFLDPDFTSQLPAGSLEIENGGKATIKSGESRAYFSVKLKGPLLAQEFKSVVFKLKSPTLKNADFRQRFILTAKQICPPADFSGTFNYTGWWNTSPGTATIEQGSAPNTLVIKNYLSAGKDLVVTYDALGNISFANQETGYAHSTYGMISIKPSTDPTHQSKVDFCSKKLTLYCNFYVSAGTFGNKEEIFIGQ